MQNDNQQPSENSLDEAIRNALHVETDAGQLKRLEHYWVVQSNRLRRRQWMLRALPAVAAALAMVATFTLWNQPKEIQTTDKSRGFAPFHEDPESAQPLLANGFLTEGAPADESRPATNSLSAGRPPTPYERLMFAVITKERVPASTWVASMDQAIDQLTLDPSKDAGQVLESLGLQPADTERMLLGKLPKASISQQAVILRFLGACGTQRAVPALLRLGGQDSLRDEALATLERIVGIDNLAKVVHLTGDRRLRAGLMLRLLSANSDAALREYLSLVRVETVRGEALAVAKSAEQLPLAALLALLDDEDTQVRLPAALVLGHVNGAEVTKQLIVRVTSKPSDSKEAWLALLACRGDLAKDFFSYATQQPKLLGHCNYARIQWAQMIP